MAPRNDQMPRQSMFKAEIRCKYCQTALYGGKSDFRQHLKVKHPISKRKADANSRHYICHIKDCYFTTKDWADMREHTNIHNGIALCCMSCSVAHPNPAYIAEHELICHGYTYREEDAPRLRVPTQQTLRHNAPGALNDSSLGSGNSETFSDSKTSVPFRTPLATIYDSTSSSCGDVQNIFACIASSWDAAGPPVSGLNFLLLAARAVEKQASATNSTITDGRIDDSASVDAPLSGLDTLLLAARTIEEQPSATNSTTTDARTDDSASVDTSETNSSLPRTPPNDDIALANIASSTGTPQLAHASVDTPTLVGHTYESLYDPSDVLDAAAGLCDLRHRSPEPYSSATRLQLPVSYHRSLNSNTGGPAVHRPNDGGLINRAYNKGNIVEDYGRDEVDEAAGSTHDAISAVSKPNSPTGRTGFSNDDCFRCAHVDSTTHFDDHCPECSSHANSGNWDKYCPECIALQAMLQIGCEACISTKQGATSVNV